MAVLFFIFEICETAFLWLYFIVAALLAAREAFTFSIALLAKPAVLSFTLVVALSHFCQVKSFFILAYPIFIIMVIKVIFTSSFCPFNYIIKWHTLFDFPSSYHLNHPLNTLPIVLKICWCGTSGCFFGFP